MEKLFTVSKIKTRSWLWLISWTPYCQIQTEIEESGENNRMGRTRDLFKKIRDTKGTFHAKMGLIKDLYLVDINK